MLRHAWLALFLFACSGDTTVRCELCGMVIDESSGWRAGAGEARFDTPKCLFRHREQGHTIERAWVIEYYAQERRDADDLFYVLGSDVQGPMGRDLVPIAGRENAERFLADHHGERILAFDEVRGEVVDALFRP
jgi:copper chaperone NosL